MKVLKLKVICFCILATIITAKPLKAEETYVVLTQWMLSTDSGGQEMPVHLPGYLGNQLSDQPLRKNNCFYLNKKVKLPEGWQGQTLSLSFRDLPGISSLYIDGRIIPPLDFDIAAKSPGAYRRSGPLTFRINPELTEKPVLMLRLIVQRTWPQSDLISSVPRLSKGLFGDKASYSFTIFKKFIQTTVATMLFLLGFLYLTGYFLRVQQAENLYLTLQYTGAGVYMLFRMGILHLILGRVDGAVAVFFLNLAVTAGTFVTITVLQSRTISRLWFLPSVILGISGLFYQSPNAYFSSVSLLLSDIMIVMVSGINIFILVKLTKLKRENALLFLIAWLVLEIACTPEYLRYAMIFHGKFGFLSNFEASEYSFIVFSILQLIALSKERSSLFLVTETMSLELKKKSRELEQKNTVLIKADRLKDEFLANTSHELRTPLNGIIGIADSLIEGAGGKISQTMTNNLTMISASGKRLANLINDILDFSKLKNRDIVLNLRPVDMRTLTENVVSFTAQMATGKQLVFENRITEDITALGDEDRLQQVLYNLIGNAVKFTPQGKIVVRAEENGDMIKISVSDTGVGIPDEKQDDIFQPFEQADASASRHFEGAGLGLGISRKLIELHQGKLWLESSSGTGATFCFTLPKSDETPDIQMSDLLLNNKLIQVGSLPPVVCESKNTDRTGAQPLAGVPRVLVVDDDPVNLQVAVNIFSMEENLAISTATNGLEVTHLIEEGRHYDLVLLDIMMPEISGLEICRWLREKFSAAELPILLVTAKNRLSDLVKSLECGANDYITKPFAKEELLARVHTHLKVRKAHEAIKENITLKDEIRLRKQTELDLRLTQRRMAGVLNMLNDAIVAVNDSFEICYCNTIFENQFGYSVDSILGKPFSPFLAEDAVQKINEWATLLMGKDRFNAGQKKAELIEIKKNDGSFVKNTVMKAVLDLNDELHLVFIIRLYEASDSENSALFVDSKYIINTLNRNREHLRTLENTLNSRIPAASVHNTDFVEDLRRIDNTLGQLSKTLVNDLPKDKRTIGVELLNFAIESWCSASDATKSQFASSSGLWTVYMDKDGNERTQTLDRYLNIKTMPKRPRWNQIIQSAEFVLESCDLKPIISEQLENMLLKIR